MKKEDFIEDQAKIFKKLYPEKTEQQIKEMCRITYIRFKHVIDSI
jgi:hypothetical protein